MELIKDIRYEFCILKFKHIHPIPYIRILEPYPVNYLEEISYADYANVEFVTKTLEWLHQEVFEHKRCFHLEQIQTTFIDVYSNESHVYKMFSPELLFKIETQWLIRLLTEWKAFLEDFYAKQWCCVPRDQVKPEYLPEVDATHKRP